MGPSQRKVPPASVGWLARSCSQPSALHDDEFRPFSYHCDMTSLRSDLLAGTVSNACASGFGGGL